MVCGDVGDWGGGDDVDVMWGGGKSDMHKYPANSSCAASEVCGEGVYYGLKGIEIEASKGIGITFCENSFVVRLCQYLARERLVFSHPWVFE